MHKKGLGGPSSSVFLPSSTFEPHASSAFHTMGGVAKNSKNASIATNGDFDRSRDEEEAEEGKRKQKKKKEATAVDQQGPKKWRLADQRR